MKYRYYWFINMIILILLVWVTITRSYDKIQSLTANWLTVLWLIWFIWLNYSINEVILEDKLIMKDTLLQYPRYRLVLAGGWVIASMVLFESPIDRLIGAFAVANICLWRDHRWSAFLALDMLWIVIISLIIKQQWLADIYAIYLYYFLVIATLTMILNSESEKPKDSLLLKNLERK